MAINIGGPGVSHAQRIASLLVVWLKYSSCGVNICSPAFATSPLCVLYHSNNDLCVPYISGSGPCCECSLSYLSICAASTQSVDNSEVRMRQLSMTRLLMRGMRFSRHNVSAKRFQCCRRIRVRHQMLVHKTTQN